MGIDRLGSLAIFALAGPLGTQPGALIRVIGPGLLSANAFKDADRAAAPGVHHFADKLGLGAATAAPAVFSRLRTGNLANAEIVHGVPRRALNADRCM